VVSRIQICPVVAGGARACRSAMDALEPDARARVACAGNVYAARRRQAGEHEAAAFLLDGAFHSAVCWGIMIPIYVARTPQMTGKGAAMPVFLIAGSILVPKLG
jgi:hypothetical protein